MVEWLKILVYNKKRKHYIIIRFDTEVIHMNMETLDMEYSILDDGTIEITKYNGKGGNVVIPSSIEGKKVTSIGEDAFGGCDSFTNITIPNSITSIGDYAFYECIKLASITIPYSVNYIGYCAFEFCTNLIRINVETGNEKYSSENGILYNHDKTKLICYPAGKKETSFSIPNNVTSIGDTFYDCIQLTNITIPNSVNIICVGAFQCDHNISIIDVESGNENYSSENGVLYNHDKTILIRYPAGKKETSFSIPDSVTSICTFAFKGCESLTSVTIPSSVTNLGDNVFEHCINLSSIIIPDGLASIGGGTFAYCTSLTSITIPNSVTNIGDYAFFICKSLTTITIPNSVTKIGRRAFYKCSNLASITIPGSVASIYKYALGYGCICNNNYEKIPDFKIYCYQGTVGKKYAKFNRFDYELK